MATAEMLSLPFETVPDDWLLSPEIGAAERERNQLRTEVDRLKIKETALPGRVSRRLKSGDGLADS